MNRVLNIDSFAEFDNYKQNGPLDHYNLKLSKLQWEYKKNESKPLMVWKRKENDQSTNCYSFIKF